MLGGGAGRSKAAGTEGRSRPLLPNPRFGATRAGRSYHVFFQSRKRGICGRGREKVSEQGAQRAKQGAGGRG